MFPPLPIQALVALSDTPDVAPDTIQPFRLLNFLPGLIPIFEHQSKPEVTIGKPDLVRLKRNEAATVPVDRLARIRSLESPANTVAT